MQDFANRIDTQQNELEKLREQVVSLEREVARQKRFEEALQKSEDRYRTLVEAMNEGLGVQDENGIIIYVNDKLALMLGYTRAEMLGQPLTDFVDPRQRDQVLNYFTQPRPTLNGRPLELQLNAKDGRQCIVLVSPAPILGRESDLRGTLAVFTDVTRLKEAERALAEERNLLRTLMDSIPDYTYIKDRESRFISTNTSHLRSLGVESLADVIGKTDFDFFPKEFAQEYYDDERRVIATGKPILNKIEESCLSTGQRMWMMTFKAPLRDSAGTVVGLVGVSRDITDLRRAERALRESEDRFRLILENSRDIAYKLNFNERTYEYVSPSSTQVCGFTPAELIALGIEGFYGRVHPDDRQRLQHHRQERMNAREDEMPAGVEYRFLHKQGGYRWMAECAGILRDEQGQAVAEIGTIRDITESKTAEQAIRNALRMEATATLAGGIAHDFNNLMVGVLGNAELLQMRLGAQDLDVARMLNTIAGSAQKAGELAQQMLAFAHGGKYQPAVININNTIEETLWLEKRRVPDTITVESRLDPGLWNTLADPAQVNQIVLNLIINAVEAIEKEGRITVTTGNAQLNAEAAGKLGIPPGEYVRLEIEDSGQGMSAEIQSHVFEPFFTTKFQGRGLGLAAVYGIVTNHGGCITVHSEFGQGTKFGVYLPAVAQKTTRRGKTAATALPTGTETILVVDDEAVVLEVTRSILERLGYKVICALNGEEAVKLANTYEDEIHLVLLDMAMPVMGGAEAYLQLRQARPQIKALICSGYELDPSAQAVIDAGANDYIQKPFRTRTLAAKVRQILDL